MRRAIAVLAGLLLSGSAIAQTSPNWALHYVPPPAEWNALWASKQDYNPLISYPPVFTARSYGSCTWDATHDVGPCIQLAINAAGANVGGGTVVIPNGTYGLSTPLTITTLNTSLVGTGYGMMSRTNISANTPNAPVILTWIGAARSAPQPQIYMLTVAPLVANQKVLIGTNVQGIMFKCNSIAGCSGELVESVRYAKQEVGSYEPAGIPYASSVVTSGSQSITVSSTAGLLLGESVVGANIPDASYVAQIVDGTHVKINAQASGSATETVTFGGEGVRLDVVDGLQDSNDTQFIDMVFEGRNLAGAANATAPSLMLGGSGFAGGSGGTHFGNTSLNNFQTVVCRSTHGLCIAINNTDHNYFGVVGNQQIGGTTASIVSNGSLDPNNGPARDNRFSYVGTSITFAGTDTGGFTSASTFNNEYYVDTANGGVTPIVGTGASVCESTSNQMAIGCYGSTASILAQVPDSTVLGGNNRGPNTTDLQAVRIDPTHVASGARSVISGGEDNLASGTDSTIPGGKLNSALGIGSVATGIQTSADLYGERCHSAGVVASGRVVQDCTVLLKAISGANTTPIRLTSDLTAASTTNCMNIRVAGEVVNMRVQLAAVDATDPTNQYAWTLDQAILSRSGGLASTIALVSGTPTTLTSGATVAGIVVSSTADTTNACYNLTFTPPTSNTHIWHVGASVNFARTD